MPDTSPKLYRPIGPEILGAVTLALFSIPALVFGCFLTVLKFKLDERCDEFFQHQGERAGKEWADFETYAKRFFFSNGNHHHYGAEKMMPGCSQAYFTELIRKSEVGQLPLDGREPEAFTAWIVPIVFDPKVDAKEVDLDAKDVIVASCNNFYSSVTQQEVETYYDGIKEADTSNRSQIGFNTRLVKENGKLVEQVWKSGGMYGAAIDKIIYWLEKAEGVAETPEQTATIAKLITFYRSGDPMHFDDYSNTSG